MLLQNIEKLKKGGIGVIPTDTLYGLVCSALKPKAVARVYRLKKRTPNKPSIILISSMDDLKLFGITINEVTLKYLSSFWPGPVSIILPCLSEDYTYLHRGTKTLAFRNPDNEKLLAVIAETGPLIAPSANTEGNPPAEEIIQARQYFQDRVDFYEEGGTLKSLPSTLIKIENNQVKILRQGIKKVPPL